jgi:hypothetical protein
LQHLGRFAVIVEDHLNRIRNFAAVVGDESIRPVGSATEAAG